jgi:hypothetical protein
MKFIRIINSKKNPKDKANSQACAQITTDACFYTDDDWNTAHYIKGFISNFPSDSNLLYSVTDSYTYYTMQICVFI